MMKPTYLMIVVALTMLIAPSLSAFPRQHGVGPQAAPSALHRGAASLAWRHGRWHHQTRNGRYGWWWDVGGEWYYYPEPFEGPPDYVSDIDVTPPPKEPRYAVYYPPGDIKGRRYETLKECWQARQQAANVGICVWK